MTVTDTPPWTKGDNAKARHKFATLSNGRKIKVPVFIDNGDRVSVNISDESYVGREGEEVEEEQDEDEDENDEDEKK
jgi:elongation factor P